jgi:ATP-binding cassette, subfamily A (ABC1), member 3
MRKIPEDQVAKVVEETLDTVMLQHDQNTLVKYLSGGMKRKLSLGKALIGDAKFIILDEPTSSLDY